MTRLARRGSVRACQLLAAGSAIAAVVRWCFDRVEVLGSSMAPTFEEGDRLLVVRRWRPLRIGDVVALDDPSSPSRTLIKRVASLELGVAMVLGDNETASTDSRSFGAVSVRSIQHLVVRRYARRGAL